MTARIRHGTKHRATHGADKGSAHERLNAQHAMPNRPEGAMLQSTAPPPPSPVPMAPPMGGGSPPPDGSAMMGPPGAVGPQEGDQS